MVLVKNIYFYSLCYVSCFCFMKFYVVHIPNGKIVGSIIFQELSMYLRDDYKVQERMTQQRAFAYATGLANVRDVIPFPRTPGSARY